MATEVGETVKGDGYAVGTLDGIGQGPGFRKVRRALDVQSVGVNTMVLPEGYDAGAHYHDEQEELYFVHQGRLEITFEEDESQRFVLGAGGLARVDASTVRRVRNPGPGEAVYFIVGAKDGYVGRDGRQADGSEITRPGAG